VAGPTHGQFTFKGDGSFAYAPDADFYGRDSFTYRASEGDLQSEVTTVSLVVTSPRDMAPVAQDDSVVVNEDHETDVQIVNLPTGDLLYDAATDRILVSVLGTGGARANTLTVIDPASGALGASLPIGMDPRDLVISDDGRYVHAAIEDRRSIQLIDLTTQMLGPKVTLSPGFDGKFPERVGQFYAIPGQPDAVLVTRYVAAINPPVVGTTIYKAGVALPDHVGTGGGSGGPNLTAVDTTGNRAFGYETYTGHHPFYVMSIDSKGLRVVQTYDQGSFFSTGMDIIRYARDRIFTNTGLVKQLSTNTFLGNFVATNNFVIDEELNKLFALTSEGTSHTVHIYDLDTLKKLDTLKLTDLPAIQGDLIRFGDNGLAFRAAGDRVVLVRSDKITGEALPSVLRNDSDPEGTELTATLVDDVAHGKLILHADGTFNYTPETNFHGTDSFKYRASDGQLESNLATVAITVASINDAPTAVADDYSVAEDGKLNVSAAQGVLANDSDVEGNSLAALLVSPPSRGTLILNADGSFIYTPDANFFGDDTFTYRANDGKPSSPATVTIHVTAVNDAPVAANDTVNVTEDMPLAFMGTELVGITPVEWSENGHYYALVRGDITWQAANAAAQSLRFRGAQGHLATLTSAAEQQFLTDLAGPANTRLWLGLTDEGTEGIFRWVTGEPLSFTNWAPGQPANTGGQEHYGEIVNLPNVPWRWNDASASWIDFGYFVEFEEPFRLGVLENDQDVDSQTLVPHLVTGPANGTLTLNSDGTFTYSPNPNFSGTDSFTYKVNDGELDSNTATVTLNVLPANDAPVAVADSYFVADTLAVNAANGVLANDTDIDSPKSSLTAQLVTPPAHGTLMLNPNGSFTYTRGLTFTGSDTFIYRTSDGSAVSEPVTVTITAAVRLRTESVTIVSQPHAPVEGFFDVYVDVAPGFDFSAAGYDVALRTPAGSGITLVSAGAPSAAHPSLFATEPTFVVSGGALRVTDALATGAAELDNGDGLFRVRFTVAPETVGDVPLLFTTAFTNLANETGDPLPIARIGGTITVNEPSAPQVSGVSVRSSEWSSEFITSLQTQGLGYAIPAGGAQFADLPWINVDQIVVRFNEHVNVQQADLVVHGVNNASYASTGFAYDPATFTATWTLEDALPADKVLIQLVADGADPIRNAAGVRLDGDWSDGSGAFPSGDGRSGGDFLFRMNVLPGNVDQTGPVNIFDTIKTRNRQFTSVGNANYDARYDINGSGEINIFDTVQVRNRQFTSLPEEPVVVAPPPPFDPPIAAAPAAVKIRTDNVAIASLSDAAAEGVFDVFVEVTPGADVSIAGYDVALLTPPPGSGVTFVSAGLPSAAHPAVFSSESTDFSSAELLGVTDALPTGAAPLTHGAGLFSVRFTVAPGAAGNVPLMFHTSFTNLADGSGSPVAVELEPGTITITPPPATITGTNGDDQYHIRRSGSQILIFENAPPVGEPTYTLDLSAHTLIINAGDGNDVLTVDPGAQAALGLHQLIYNAGSGDNTLELTSGSARIDSTATGGMLNTTVNAGAQLSTAQLKQNGLSLAENSRVALLPDSDTSIITSLTLGTAATLDIGNNALVVDYAGDSPVAAIREQIRSGRGTTGLGATWTGTGITSSSAAASNATDPEAHSVGYAENAALPLGPYTSFRGQPIDDTAILIAYVRTSDANLDGVVNDSDVTIVGATYAPTVPNASWALGDFDFDGFIDDDDVTMLGVFYDPAASAPAQAPDELIDLLAESFQGKNGSQAASLAVSDKIVGRQSRTLDSFWSSWKT
jgi:VCBS repeat-containing protein